MSRSSTAVSDKDLLANPHPGEILLEEFLKPMGLSQNALARAIHVPPRRINEIVLGKRTVSADTDLRLARYFGLSEGFFPGAPGRPRSDAAAARHWRRAGKNRSPRGVGGRPGGGQAGGVIRPRR